VPTARPTKSRSNPWLIGATLGGYLVIAFGLRINGAPPESHLVLILSVLVGVLVTLLGVLQGVFSVQVSWLLTRISLWLNFLAIFCFGLAGVGTKHTVLPWHFLVLLASVLALPLGLVLSVVNILWGWLRRDDLPNIEPHG
jgi:hypothetical protein